MDAETYEIMRRALAGNRMAGRKLPDAPEGKVHVYDILTGRLTGTTDDDEPAVNAPME